MHSIEESNKRRRPRVRSIRRRTHRTSNRPAGARSAAESPRDRDHRCLVCAFTVFSEIVYELVRSRSQYRYMCFEYDHRGYPYAVHLCGTTVRIQIPKVLGS